MRNLDRLGVLDAKRELELLVNEAAQELFGEYGYEILHEARRALSPGHSELPDSGHQLWGMPKDRGAFLVTVVGLILQVGSVWRSGAVPPTLEELVDLVLAQDPKVAEAVREEANFRLLLSACRCAIRRFRPSWPKLKG